MISDINDDTKEITKSEDETVLNLFYEKQAGKNLKSVDSLLKFENIETSKKIVMDDDLFLKLNNAQKFLLTEILIKDKINTQEYISKILKSADHELIFSLAKNKDIYISLNGENKKYLKNKLDNNPWIKNKIDIENY